MINNSVIKDKDIKIVPNTTTRKDHIYLILVVTALVIIGILGVCTCTPMIKLDTPYIYIKKHFISIFIGIITFIFVSKIDYKKYKKIAFPLYIFTFILLFLPIFFPEQKGANRWIELKFIHLNFQPSELAKIVMVIVMADFLERRKDKINIWKYNVIPSLYMFLFCTVIAILQKDFGSAILISLIWFALLIVSKIDMKRILLIVAMYLIALPILIIIEPYRLTRITKYLKYGEVDKVSKSLDNMQASFAAFGSGGFFGKGAGQSEMKLRHLPEMHTDFIFPIIGEEYGFWGTSITVFLFILFTKIAISINKNCKDDFGKLLSFGIMLIISGQAIINMAMTTGVFPAKGFPLPFISFGGSSMIINFLMIGILYNIARSNNKQQ